MTTIDKAADVLRALADIAPFGQLPALEEATGIPKPTLYRILRVLMERNMVYQDQAGMYRVGTRVFSLAASAFSQHGVGDHVRRLMVELGRQVHLAVHVSGFRADQLLYLDKLEADTPFYMRSEIGRLQAIHSSAIGRSILSELDAETARRVLTAHSLERFTPYTVVDVDEILRDLPAVKKRGYAIDDEEDELSTRAIGAAFRDLDGRPVGGISIVAPTFETSLAELEEHAPALTAAAGEIQSLIAAPSSATDRVS